MSMDAEMRDALNEQVDRELYAAYLYLAMTDYFESEALPGMASWMAQQAAEERGHAMRIVEHLHDRGERVTFGSIDAPPGDYDSPLAAFRAALEHEQHVTESIHELYAMAVEKGDYPAQVLLQWFVEEQVEEEKSAGDIVDQLERVGDSGASLLVLDGRLGERGGEG